MFAKWPQLCAYGLAKWKTSSSGKFPAEIGRRSHCLARHESLRVFTWERSADRPFFSTRQYVMNATLCCMKREQSILRSNHEGGRDAKSLCRLHVIVRFIGRNKRMRGSLFRVKYLEIRALSLLVRRKRCHPSPLSTGEFTVNSTSQQPPRQDRKRLFSVQANFTIPPLTQR
jgi:hypothetical protein